MVSRSFSRLSKHGAGNTGLFCVAALLFLSPSPDAFAGNAVYIYDSLGRITRVVYSNGLTVIYNCGLVGNRTSVVVQGAL
jgi:hypothetical protein